MRAPDAKTYRASFVLDALVVQGAGVVQGGVLAGLVAEAVEGFAQEAIDIGRTVALETLEVVFERPALPGSFTVEAALTRNGRSLLVWEATLLDADRRTIVSARTTHRVEAGVS